MDLWSPRGDVTTNRGQKQNCTTELRRARYQIKFKTKHNENKTVMQVHERFKEGDRVSTPDGVGQVSSPRPAPRSVVHTLNLHR